MSISGGSTSSKRIALFVAGLAAVIAVTIAGCGGGSSSSTGASGASGASGEAGAAADISTTYAKPKSDKADQIGAELIKAVDIGNLSNILASTFQIPQHIDVKAINGIDSPFWYAKDSSITFQYGFAWLVYDTLKTSNPTWSSKQVGYATGAVLGFILEHEFTHALISIYDLPVLGKEEDAADTLATLLLLKSPQGARLALSAAEFWDDFSGRQNPPALADYAEEHSLDLQRSFTIVCEIAGSSDANYALIKKADILPPGQIQTCPAQYQQDVKSFTQVLDPHIKGSVTLQAPSG